MSLQYDGGGTINTPQATDNFLTYKPRLNLHLKQFWFPAGFKHGPLRCEQPEDETSKSHPLTTEAPLIELHQT